MKVSAIRWVFVAKDELQPGRLVRLTEPGGRVLWEICEGEMSPEALKALDTKHIAITEAGVWTGEPDAPADVDPPGQMTAARYEIVPARFAASFKDEVVVTYEEGGIGTCMIPEGHLSERLKDQINEELEGFTGRGVWIRWKDYESLVSQAREAGR